MSETCQKCKSSVCSVARDMKATRKCANCGHTWLPSEIKLTDWEIGQDLIAISDFIAENTNEFKYQKPELYKKLLKMRAEIGDEFNKLKSHKFGIFDSSNLDEDSP